MVENKNLVVVENVDEEETAARRENDYLLLTIFVLSQHGRYDRASRLVEGIIATGKMSREIILAKAVLEFFKEDYALALECLDELDALEQKLKFSESKEISQMRKYLRARCYFQSDDPAKASEIVRRYTAKPQNKKPKKLDVYH